MPTPERPITRGDCRLPSGPLAHRPCPWISCRFHLLEVDLESDGCLVIGNGHGRQKVRSDADVEAVATKIASYRRDSCAIDVADRQNGDAPTAIGIDDDLQRRREGATLEVIADVFGITRERVRQIETQAKARLVGALRRRGVVAR